MGQAEVFLADPSEMGRQDDAPAVSGPSLDVERRVVPRQVRVARVAEDALDEIQVGDQSTGHEESHFHPLFRRDLRDRGADQWTQEERDHRLHRLGPVGCEWQPHERGGRAQRLLEEPEICCEWHTQLVGRNGKATFGDMKDALGGPAIVDRVVEDAVVETIARHQLVLP